MGGRKRIIYAMILVLAGGAFLVDRLFVSGSEKPTDEDPAAAEAPATQSPGREQPAGSKADWFASDRFPADLPSWSRDIVIRDVFAGPDTESPDSGSTSGSHSRSTSGMNGRRDLDKTTAEDFGQRHSLNGVMVIGDETFVNIDGQLIRIGQVFDGCVLVHAEGRTATFRCGEALTTLKMPLGAPSR